MLAAVIAQLTHCLLVPQRY